MCEIKDRLERSLSLALPSAEPKWKREIFFDGVSGTINDRPSLVNASTMIHTVHINRQRLTGIEEIRFHGEIEQIWWIPSIVMIWQNQECGLFAHTLAGVESVKCVESENHRPSTPRHNHRNEVNNIFQSKRSSPVAKVKILLWQTAWISNFEYKIARNIAHASEKLTPKRQRRRRRRRRIEYEWIDSAALTTSSFSIFDPLKSLNCSKEREVNERWWQRQNRNSRRKRTKQNILTIYLFFLFRRATSQRCCCWWWCRMMRNYCEGVPDVFISKVVRACMSIEHVEIEGRRQI